MIATTGTAAGRCAAGTPCSAEPAASADADVVVMTISRVLAVSPPAIGPAKLAYRPWTGLTPAKMAAAIPSGTLPTAPGNPASRSRPRYRRCGPTERSHPHTACPADPNLDITTWPPRQDRPGPTRSLEASTAELDDPAVEGLHRAVVVRVAVVEGELRDQLVKAGHCGVRDVTAVGEHRPDHALGATGRGERAVVGVKRLHPDRALARHADFADVTEQLSRAGFTRGYLLARRFGRRKEDLVEQPIRLGADAEEDTDNGRDTLRVRVDQVCLQISLPAVDGVLRWRVEVVLLQLVAVAVDLQRVADADRDRHLHHVPGVLDAELGRLIPQQQWRAVVGGQLAGPDVDRRLIHARTAGREPDVAPVQGPDRRRRIVVPRPRGRLGRCWPPECSDAEHDCCSPPVLSSSRRVSTATMRLLSESRAVKRQDRAGPALLTGEGRPRLLRQIHERLSADVDRYPFDRAAGERPWSLPGVVVGDRFAARAADHQPSAGRVELARLRLDPGRSGRLVADVEREGALGGHCVPFPLEGRREQDVAGGDGLVGLDLLQLRAHEVVGVLQLAVLHIQRVAAESRAFGDQHALGLW